MQFGLSATPQPPIPLTPDTLRPLVAARMARDSAHDWHHIERVFHLGLRIAATEPEADATTLRAALLLHDLGEKLPAQGNRPLAEPEVRAILAPLGVDAARLPAILVAINEHSYSRGAPPSTLEAAIVQDADRLDALGAIGIARTFAYGGARGRALYDPMEPGHSIQHFYDKLLRLRDGMHTAEGRRLAEPRHAVVAAFVAQFLREWSGDDGERPTA